MSALCLYCSPICYVVEKHVNCCIFFMFADYTCNVLFKSSILCCIIIVVLLRMICKGPCERERY
uniref:Uncharacterized protein n=1 Tax=Rhizophora mucronata TaxID=61149 RepID=A0A2P2Q2G0_RHIMU